MIERWRWDNNGWFFVFYSTVELRHDHAARQKKKQTRTAMTLVPHHRIVTRRIVTRRIVI
jgi:hypothetical protein